MVNNVAKRDTFSRNSFCARGKYKVNQVCHYRQKHHYLITRNKVINRTRGTWWMASVDAKFIVEYYTAAPCLFQTREFQLVYAACIYRLHVISRSMIDK